MHVLLLIPARRPGTQIDENTGALHRINRGQAKFGLLGFVCWSTSSVTLLTRLVENPVTVYSSTFWALPVWHDGKAMLQPPVSGLPRATRARGFAVGVPNHPAG